MDTIYAVSSGAPPAALAVLRICGPEALVAAERLVGKLPVPRRAGLRAVRDAEGGLLDRALVLVFPGPDTETGEDMAELHLHGGRAIIRAVERALAAQGLRLAEPGEFTRRALLNGRIDLTQAEGLGDLLMAETEAQRRAAIGAAEGVVRQRVGGWAERALALAASVEAALDHSDEADVADPLPALHAGAASLAEEIAGVLREPPVERLRDGVRVVLAGPPNSGKSTLLNALAEREAAIVSPVAGTTRDRIEVPLVRDGRAYVLIDTAGLAEATADAIEAIGIERAREAMAAADLVVWLGDEAPPAGSIAIHPRMDASGRERVPAGRIGVSAATRAGLDALWQAIAARAAELLPAPDAFALNARQRGLAGEAAEALRAASEESDLLIAAEHLRRALRAFDRITGAADVEAMLDTLFSRFCIGK